MSNELAQKNFLETEIIDDRENRAEKLKFCILQSAKSMSCRNRLLLFSLEK